MSRYVTFQILIVSLAAIFFGCGKSGNMLQPAQLQKFANISLQKAESLALGQARGVIETSNIALKNGMLVYRFRIKRPDGKQKTVYIDAKNGTLVLEKKERDEQNTEKNESGRLGLHKQLDRIRKIFNRENEKSIEGTIPVTRDTDLTSLAKVGEIEAQDAAVSLTGGNVENIRLENEDGYLVYVVQIRYKGDLYYVLVDAGNNKVLEIDSKN